MMLDSFVVVTGLARACALGRRVLNLKSESSAAALRDAFNFIRNINMRDAREYLLILDTRVCWRKFIISNNDRTLITLEGKPFTINWLNNNNVLHLCRTWWSFNVLRCVELRFYVFLLLFIFCLVFTHSLPFFITTLLYTSKILNECNIWAM